MKVLHLINTLSAGGAELHLLSLSRCLKARGVGVVVASLREQAKGSRPLRVDFEREGMRVVHLEADSRYDCRFPLRLVSILKQERPDVLHTHLPRADFAGAIARTLHASVPWLCSIHDIYSKSWSGKWTLPLFGSIWRRADSIIAISHAVKDWLVCHHRVPSDKVTVVHYGIEADRFSSPLGDVRKGWGLDGRLLVGTIGRLEPRKGHDILIRAMPAILKQVPNASLLIAGHDPWGYGKVLQALIADLKLNGQVYLVGFQEDVPSFLHGLDMFVLPSLSEGFGQVVIEAMAAGKPVVASNVSAIPEIVVDGETGVLVPPGDSHRLADAICRLLEDVELQRRMGKAGERRVEEAFGVYRMVQETERVYEAVLRIR